MKFSNLSWIALPLVLATGCVYSHRDYAYTRPGTTTVVAPTSPRPAVRVYPDSTTARAGRRPGEIDDMSIAGSVRTILARDTAHVYGNVDISVNRASRHCAERSRPNMTRNCFGTKLRRFRASITWIINSALICVKRKYLVETLPDSVGKNRAGSKPHGTAGCKGR